MKILLKALLAASTIIAVPAFAQAPAAAPVASAPGYAAIADLRGAITQSAAFQAAAAQIQTQYKTQIDAYNVRRAPLVQELQRLEQEVQTLQRTAGTPEATLQAKAAAYQTRAQAIQTELAPLSAPFERPLAYVEEQVAARIDQATRAAMAAKRVTMLVRPEALAFAMPTANITGDIVTQLNALVKTASTTPPANWQPGQAGAAPGAAAPTAAPAPAAGAPAGTAPTPRPRPR